MTPTKMKLLLAAALAAISTHCAAQLTIRDDLGRPLILKASAKRIVTLSPSLTELVFAAGAGNAVVGVDSLSDYPPEAKKAAQIATGAQFSIDQLAALKPDLVLAWREGIRREDIERITAFGAVVFVAQARSLADIPRLLEVVGRMTGRDTSPVISDFEARLERVKRAHQGKARMSAFLEIWNRPLTTISGSHFLSEALDICRADNVFRELTGAAPKVTWEQLSREDPYVIVGAGSASGDDEFRANWRIRQSLSAVRAQRLVYLDSDTIQRPTPRTPEGIEQLCETLDRVRAAKPGDPPAVIRTERASPPRALDPESPFSNPLPAIAAPGRPTAPLASVPAAPAATLSAGTKAPETTLTQAPAATAPTQTPPRQSQYGM